MNLKEKIIYELTRRDFPNLKFLYSSEVLDYAPELLEEFLEEEKKDFDEKLKLKNEEITFDTFDEESEMSFFWSLLNHLLNVQSSDKLRKIVEDFEPKLMEFSNDISYNKRYFEMTEYCFKNCDLDEEQKKILEDSIKGFKIKWINLEKEKQDELKKISLELSELTTKFSNNVLDSEKEFEYILESDDFLKEFSKSDLENAQNLYKKKMKEKGLTEKIDTIWYAFDSSASSYIAIMKYCSSSDIREYFSESHSSFASSWKFDNREIILNLIRLKNKKARLLNYKNYAELSLEFKMAETPKQVLELLTDLSKKAKPKALDEIEEIKDYFNLKEINSWDVAYYSRILKEKKYKLDDKKLKEYFEFENTQNALFETVGKLYDIRMEKIDAEWKYGEDIEIYKVYEWENFISYFMWDYFYNPDKRSWAWADAIREKFGDKKQIVINNMSFVKSENWKTLLSLDEVTTLFHEFWHAIHWMLSSSKYSDLSWFWVERDFIELPSQLLEKWAEDDLTINNIAKHYKSWEKLSTELLESLKNLKYYGTWGFVLGQNMFAIIDMMFYSWIDFSSVEEMDKIYLEKVNEISIFKKDENYKMYASFGHIFGWGYAAGYYSYMWADIIVDEIWTVFKEKWVYNKEVADKFKRDILWAWSIKKAKKMFYDFMWREINTNAFLEEKWLK